MEITYAQRLKLLHQLCLAETLHDGAQPAIEPGIDFEAMDVEASAHYVASYVTFRAIQEAGRHPGEELNGDFDMLGVYQCYALMVYAFLMMPLAHEASHQPDYGRAQMTIAKTLFDGAPAEIMAEIIESGLHKFQLIAETDAEHWQEYRENLDKVTISFMIAVTDDDSPHGAKEIAPLFGQLLSQLCEAFSAA